MARRRYASAPGCGETVLRHLADIAPLDPRRLRQAPGPWCRSPDCVIDHVLCIRDGLRASPGTATMSSQALESSQSPPRGRRPHEVLLTEPPAWARELVPSTASAELAFKKRDAPLRAGSSRPRNPATS